MDAEQALDEAEAATNPPAIAPIDKLVRTPLEAAELDGGALHVREPTEERTIVDRGVGIGRPGRSVVGADVRLEEHPGREGAEGVAAMCLAEHRARCRRYTCDFIVF